MKRSGRIRHPTVSAVGIEGGRKRQPRIGGGIGCGQHSGRPDQQVLDGHRRVGGLADEAAVGPVLQQPAHEIGKQVRMAPDRRIDPNGRIRMLRQQAGIEGLSHAMQTLELIAPVPLRAIQDGGDRERVMGCELRIQARSQGQQPFRGRHIDQIGGRLAREYGIAIQPALLRALDLGIPVGAFDQPIHETAMSLPGQGSNPVNDSERTLAISLNGEAEAIPPCQCLVRGDRGDHIKRQFEPVLLLGIHGEGQVVAARGTGEPDHDGHQLRHDATPADRLVARVKRRQLDRDTGPVRQRPVAGGTADRFDGIGVAGSVACGVRRRAGALPQHVEAVAEHASPATARTAQRLFDRLTEHEMRAQAPAPPPAPPRARRVGRCAWPAMPGRPPASHSGTHDPAETPRVQGRGRHQERVASRRMIGKATAREHILHQPVSRGHIGHAQQRFGEHHDRQALLRGQAVFPQQCSTAPTPPRCVRIASGRRRACKSIRASRSGGSVAANSGRSLSASAGA